jgi:hypothetical protein
MRLGPDSDQCANARAVPVRSFLTFKFSHFAIFAVSEEDCRVPGPRFCGPSPLTGTRGLQVRADSAGPFAELRRSESLAAAPSTSVRVELQNISSKGCPHPSESPAQIGRRLGAFRSEIQVRARLTSDPGRIPLHPSRPDAITPRLAPARPAGLGAPIRVARRSLAGPPDSDLGPPPVGRSAVTTPLTPSSPPRRAVRAADPSPGPAHNSDLSTGQIRVVQRRPGRRVSADCRRAALQWQARAVPGRSSPSGRWLRPG